MLQALFPRVGFAWATRIMALIFVVLLGIANLLIRSRLGALQRAGKAPTTTTLSSVLPDFTIFRSPTFALTTAGVFFIEWGLFVPLSYISSYALAHGVAPALAYQLLAVLNAGSFFGRWLPGYVADRLGRFNTMILTVALSLLTTLALWLPAAHSLALLCLYAVLFGFASGSNISLTSVCVGQLCETQHYGRYYATCYTVVSFGTLTGIPIAGQILAVTGTAGGGGGRDQYWGLIVFTALCYVGGLVTFTAARVLEVGWRIGAVF